LELPLPGALRALRGKDRRPETLPETTEVVVGGAQWYVCAMNKSETRVTVTGATGFIALHCVQQLLEEGYRVRGTLRRLSKEPAVRAALVLRVASPVPAAPQKNADELVRPHAHHDDGIVPGTMGRLSDGRADVLPHARGTKVRAHSESRMRPSALPCSLALCAALSCVLPVYGCGDDDASDAGPATGKACEPLTAGAPKPITLDVLIAAGKDADDVVYAVDEHGGELRVFVSESGRLERRRVLGSGSGKQGDLAFYQLEVEGDPDFGLYIEAPAGGDAVMTKTEAGDRKLEPDASVTGETLDPVTESELDALELTNLPDEVTVEYFAKLEDGRRVVVTRPTDDWTYDDFRVFVGEVDDVQEREVKSVTRARDGGSTTIELTLDGKPATLSFPIAFVDGGLEPGPATLELGGDTLDLELLDMESSALGDLAFFCR